MQNQFIEVFYLFFQGILVFQIITFGFIYVMTKRRDTLFYALFLFFAAVYFFVNAPYTFFGISEDVVWNSAWYDFINTPLVILENLCYILFLKSFYQDISADQSINKLFVSILWLIAGFSVLFILLTLAKIDKQFIFYSVKLIAVLPAFWVIHVIRKNNSLFSALISSGLICTIVGTCTTVLIIVLRNYGYHHLFTDGYPLLFIRLGILGDMIFYLAAILKKWHYQEKELAVEKIKGQLIEERARLQFSSELHDEVGSTLSGISMYLHLVHEQLNQGKIRQANDSLKILQHSTNEINTQVKDLIWGVKPSQDTMAMLLEHLEGYAIPMAAAKNIYFSSSMEISGNTFVPPKAKRQIYLILKEAINNALKYSEATTIDLKITTDKDSILFLLWDNGIGFDVATSGQGNGLRNIEKRAADVHAQVSIKSVKNQGTEILLTLLL